MQPELAIPGTGRTIGGGARCLVVAEAGSNHDGSLDRARRLVEVAAEAGADAVKFQVFRARSLYPRSAGTSDYLGLPKAIYDVIEELETPYDWLPVLAGACERAGLLFMASAFDEESVDRLDPFVALHKVASYELTHLPLVRHVAARGKPLVVSTGTADLGEVRETVAALSGPADPGIVLLQCTAAYPAPFGSLQLRGMTALREAFGVPVGLSDHSRDPVVAPVAAVALGASLVEKHFTLCNDLPGPDHRFALEPDELARMVRAIRDAETALGDGGKHVDPAERELRDFARRSVFAVASIAAGEPFTPANVRVLRNGRNTPGLAPKELPLLLGRRAARDLAPDVPVAWADVA